MSKYIGVAEPWDIVYIDFMGPITPVSADSYAYILINIDYLTRFLNATATVKATAEAVCDVWNNRISGTFGWPRRIYCDNGSHFKNLLFTATTEKHGTRLIHGPVSHPQSTVPSSQVLCYRFVGRALSFCRWYSYSINEKKEEKQRRRNAVSIVVYKAQLKGEAVLFKLAKGKSL